MWLLSLLLPIAACLPSKHQDTIHHEAVDLLSASINSSIEPCDDFYDFACGGWIEQHPLPASAADASVSTTEIMMNTTFDTLRDLLSEKEPHTSKAVEMLKLLYQSCMDTEAFGEDKGQAMIKLVNRTDPHFDLTLLLANAFKAQRAGISQATPFFHLSADQEKEGKSELKMRNPFTLSREYRSKLKDAAFKILSAYTSDLGEEVIAESIRQDVEDILEMEARIAESLVGGEDQTINISELGRVFYPIDWHRFLKLVVGPEQLALFKTIRVKNTDELAHLAKVINSTSPRTIKNYFVLYYSMMYSLQLDSGYSAFNERLLQVPRWFRCLDLSKTLSAGQALSALYVSKVVDPASKTAVEEMASDIRQTFIEILNENEWMDTETKEKAVKKAKAMVFHIGYDASLISDAALSTYYQELDVSTNDTFAEQYQKWLTWASYNKFRDELIPVDHSGYGFRHDLPIDMLAFHESNTITIPATYIQQPLFFKFMPAALNYGALGAIIAHEITHGFATNGPVHDFGELYKNDTLRNNTLKEFDNVKQCIVEQYNEFEVPEIKTHVSGELTSEENMADLGGVKTAFRVFQRYTKKHGSGLKIAGKTGELYSDDQLFFLAHAQAFCSHRSPALAAMFIKNDKHAPSRFRINGALSNLKEFADAFHCAPGTSMNPKKQCKIW